LDVTLVPELEKLTLSWLRIVLLQKLRADQLVHFHKFLRKGRFIVSLTVAGLLFLSWNK
jgi:hypothetical protein